MAAGMSFVRNDSVLVAVVCLFLLLLLLSLTVVVCVLRRSAAAAEGRSTDFDRHIEFEIDNNHLASDKLKLMQFLVSFFKGSRPCVKILRNSFYSVLLRHTRSVSVLFCVLVINWLL